MGMLGYRTQSDSNHLGVMPPDVENYSLLEQVDYQVFILEIIFILMVITISILHVIIRVFQIYPFMLMGKFATNSFSSWLQNSDIYQTYLFGHCLSACVHIFFSMPDIFKCSNLDLCNMHITFPI